MSIYIKRLFRVGFLSILLGFCWGLLLPDSSQAASAREISIEVDAALQQFIKEVNGAETFLEKSEGVLVFPRVVKIGMFIGGEYGEGAMLVGGTVVDYYSTASASIGLQIGAQTKSVILVFLSHEALRDFRNSDGWKAGIDGSGGLAKWGAEEDINSIYAKDPVVGFVFGNSGFMYNLTLEGAKFTRIER